MPGYQDRSKLKPTMGPLRIHLFGRLQVQDEHTTLNTLSMRRVGALLACLVLRFPQPIPREELLALIWPEEPLEVAQNRLRVLLNALRRHLSPVLTEGTSVVLAERSAVQLVPSAFTSDYHDFLSELLEAKVASNDRDSIPHLEAAISHYRGELLAGYCDEWILAERSQLASMRYQAVRELVHRLIQIDEPQQIGRASCRERV